jgi:dipeptide/tripeptide permease
MNSVSRLFFATLSALAIGIFAYGCESSDKLSDGQILILWSLVPASLMLSAAACYTKERANEVIAFMVMFVGAFFAMLCFGMYKQSHETAYAVFAWLGLMLCGTSVGMMMLSTISLRAYPSRG